jgi:muramidase (phage lysozyme)
MNRVIIIIIIATVTVIVVMLLYKKFLLMRAKESVKEPNVKAFLQMIRHAEGTAGPNGYRMMYTGKLFDSFADHPRIVNCATSNGTRLCSSAAGAYQFLTRTWNVLQSRLGLPDFSPESQDIAAVELIREQKALDDVIAGRFDVAVNKVKNIWASMPGAGYGQPEKKLADLRTVYVNNGGKLA